MTQFYCPSCGEETNDEEVDYALAPGEVIKWECKCGICWNILVNYEEVED